MEDDGWTAIAGQPHVELYSIGAQRECCAESGESILGSVRRCAAVGDDLQRHRSEER